MRARPGREWDREAQPRVTALGPGEARLLTALGSREKSHGPGFGNDKHLGNSVQAPGPIHPAVTSESWLGAAHLPISPLMSWAPGSIG